MIRRKAVETVGCVVLLAWAVCFASPARGQDDDLPEQIVRYIGVRTGTGDGGREAILYVEPMKGGKPVEVVLGTTSRMVDYFTKLAPGQLVTVGLVRRQGKLYLASISAMRPRPGEADRDTAYVKGVEVRKDKGKDTTVLVLTKFNYTMVVEVPQVRTKDGQEPSPELLKASKAIKSGTLVEVDVVTRRGKLPELRFITAWAPWRAGNFSKLGRKKIDKSSYVTVEIKSSGIPLVLLVPKVERYGKLSDDRTILNLVRKLKRDQAVEFKIRQDGLNQAIRKIRLATGSPAARR